jgi:hypothetical protein
MKMLASEKLTWQSQHLVILKKNNVILDAWEETCNDKRKQKFHKMMNHCPNSEMSHNGHNITGLVLQSKTKEAVQNSSVCRFSGYL